MTFEIGSPRPGDAEWIVAFHRDHYGRALGYDHTFVTLVAEIVEYMMRAANPLRERVWVARENDDAIGSIMVSECGANDAKLRLFFVDPTREGQGVGRALIERCIGFAEAAGYRSLSLTTTEAQRRARKLYANVGFERTDAWESRAFGSHQVEESWRLTL